MTPPAQFRNVECSFSDWRGRGDADGWPAGGAGVLDWLPGREHAGESRPPKAVSRGHRHPPAGGGSLAAENYRR
ncbi:hypothetical protein Sgleb_60520 [Streptomyces glebosus]|uniref:Uncharacterized protein n=1 Tax=Streptomyces glebosus TaxID=249580 RepID=A0A640T8M4_9ACTN|nr:hypothetical protein Sgleb_60520 [Streptomyces glebosus]GHG46613.1 hypothetical protein GCM10010513_02480 [Streptomyces glebosus]